LTAASTIAVAPQADAGLFYWRDPDPGYYYRPPVYRPLPPIQPRKQRPRRPSAKTEPVIKQTSVKPQGPLIIAVSINQQKVRVYDANGLFAESPVSTGMKGHSTPTGVFSIIQKRKWHRSNIYSGAPMPYMQRITWSGIAMHAGVLPGYPASHGCIRMPTAFAVKMWNWTKMGARVIITPGEITPASFSHPFLMAQKVVPQPLIAGDPATDAPAVKGDKGADAGDLIRPAHSSPENSQASLDLRSTVGHAAPLREQTHTADASAMPTPNAAVTMSDAGPAGSRMPPAGDSSSIEAKVETSKSEVSASEGVKIDDKPVEANAVAPDVTKDTARLPGAENAVTAKPEPPRRPGRIAVFVSRKDAKLYVREDFKPQFDVPVTIAPSDRPLGTHVFTAEVDKNDHNLLHWSVVSLPVTARNAARVDENGRSPRSRKTAGGAPAEAKPLPLPNSAGEALDRITLPQDAIARIAEALTTGGSITVSDHGINQGGETGEGTDFIVPLW
jgi:lipoprotein-anchoring transpeptidase ErfK/SrfK